MTENDPVVELHPKVLLDAALKYALRGFRVLPLNGIRAGVCTCGDSDCRSPGKHPLTAHGATEASSDEMTIRGWWSKWPTANIGLAMGDAGCVALDVDTRNLGHLSWDALIHANGALPETPTQRSGNGWHYLVKIDAEAVKRCRGKLAQGIDVKANGYIVAEPSIHHSGRRYAWDDGLDLLAGFTPARAPVWLERLLMEPAAGKEGPSSPNLGNYTLPVQLAEAADALKVLDAEDYHQWIEAGMALHATNLGDLAYQVWVEWSGQSGKFDHKVQRAKWLSFSTKRVAGVTIKTLFSRAQAAGWKNPMSGTSSAPDKTITAENHPFANFLPYALGNLEPDEFIFDDILIAGVTLLAGFTGIGKTTALVPLMTRAAHLCDADDTLRPLLRRRVIYVSEDPKQVVRVLTSMREDGELTATDAEISEWFKIVPAKRMDAASIVKVREIYQAMVYRNVSKETGVSYDALPIVVLDTSNANIELENESDNSEVGKAVSTLKSELGGIPLIIVAHLAKTLKKADISDMTSRGAGAWEGDVNQVLYMTKEDDGARWLDVAQAKHRFVTKADGIVFRAVESEIKGRDMLGNEKNIFLMHCKPEMVQRGGREAMQEQSKQVAARNKEVAEQMVRIGRKKRIKAILDDLKVGEYKTKNELSKEMGGNKDANLELINEMVEDGLIEQFVPSLKRDKNHNNGYRMTSNGGQEYENASKGI
jgi:RecA-family ATPase